MLPVHETEVVPLLDRNADNLEQHQQMIIEECERMLDRLARLRD
jgi:hypothetical protein